MHDDRDVGVSLAQRVIERRGKAPHERHARQADNHPAGPAGGRAVSAIEGRGDVADELCRAARERLPGGRRRDASWMPLEQRHAEFTLEVVDLPGERRLRHVQLGGGTAQVAFLCGGQEVAKMA